MLVSTTALIKWNPKNKERYVDLGYTFTKYGAEFEVNIEDLPDYSKTDVVVKCDYCGNEVHKRWINYIIERKRNIVNKDACSNCVARKQQDTMLAKYNVRNPMQVQQFKDKLAETNTILYGFTNVSSAPEIRARIAETNIRKYGGIAPTASDAVKRKVASTCLEKYGAKSPLSLWDRTGENNPNWKGGVSYNYVDRLSKECIDWRKAVYKKDNYTCQCCGVKNSKGNHIILNAHHVYNWSDYESLRFDINNGITLCNECHINFHKIYGKKLNNKSQIEEFLNNYGQKVC